MGNEVGTSAAVGTGTAVGNAAGQPARPPGQPAPGNTPGQRVTEFTRYPQEVKDRALQMIDEKVPYREIAAQVGPHCSTATIARWKKERDGKQHIAPILERFEQHRIALDHNEEIQENRERFGFLNIGRR